MFAIAILTLTATAVTAGEYTDVNSTFRLTKPDDWAAAAPPIDGIAVVITSPRRADTGGNCNVAVVPVEATKSMTQAEIEASMSAEFTQEGWKEGIKTVRGFKSTNVEKFGDRMQRGRKVFFVKATSDFVIGTEALSVTQLQDFHPIPGRLYVVTCTARAAGFETEAAHFDMIMTSFEPIPHMTVSADRGTVPSRMVKPGRAPILLGAGRNAAGVSLEVGVARVVR
jgi:hypothetical protein